MSNQTPATPNQIGLIGRLAHERGIDLAPLAEAYRFKSQASGFIDWLIKQPKVANPATPTTTAEQLTPGVYEHEGEVYVVKLNREKTHLYAKKLVEIGGNRLTEADTVVQIDFEYAPGAVRDIKASERMTLERAKELTVRYGRCLNCGAFLKDAKSVERGIGPVCRKSFKIAA